MTKVWVMDQRCHDNVCPQYFSSIRSHRVTGLHYSPANTWHSYNQESRADLLNVIASGFTYVSWYILENRPPYHLLVVFTTLWDSVSFHVIVHHRNEPLLGSTSSDLLHVQSTVVGPNQSCMMTVGIIDYFCGIHRDYCDVFSNLFRLKWFLFLRHLVITVRYLSLYITVFVEMCICNQWQMTRGGKEKKRKKTNIIPLRDLYYVI